MFLHAVKYTLQERRKQHDEKLISNLSFLFPVVLKALKVGKCGINTMLPLRNYLASVS
jgi:hypothetical protein